MTAILGGSAALFCASAMYASNCNGSNIIIENNTDAPLKIMKVEAENNSKIDGINVGDVINVKDSKNLKVSAGLVSNGNAQGKVVLLTNNNLEVILSYRLVNEGNIIGEVMGKGTCRVEEATGSASGQDAPIVVPNVQNGSPATIAYSINK